LRPLRYLLAGAFNTAVSYGAFAAATLAGFSLVPASAIGLIAGIAVGFFTQGKLVFRRLSVAAFLRFLATWAGMYGLFLSTAAGLSQLGLHALVAGALATACVTAVSYFVLRDWVFREQTPRSLRCR
jgi:putative flippase GtrA